MAYMGRFSRKSNLTEHDKKHAQSTRTDMLGDAG